MASDEFVAFVEHVRPRLAKAFVAAYGRERGQDALAETLAGAWERFPAIAAMANPAVPAPPLEIGRGMSGVERTSRHRLGRHGVGWQGGRRGFADDSLERTWHPLPLGGAPVEATPRPPRRTGWSWPAATRWRSPCSSPRPRSPG